MLEVRSLRCDPGIPSYNTQITHEGSCALSVVAPCPSRNVSRETMHYGIKPLEMLRYLPMQNREKITPRRSSELNSPVISPRAS